MRIGDLTLDLYHNSDTGLWEVGNIVKAITLAEGNTKEQAVEEFMTRAASVGVDLLSRNYTRGGDEDGELRAEVNELREDLGQLGAAVRLLTKLPQGADTEPGLAPVIETDPAPIGKHGSRVATSKRRPGSKIGSKRAKA